MPPIPRRPLARRRMLTRAAVGGPDEGLTRQGRIEVAIHAGHNIRGVVVFD